MRSYPVWHCLDTAHVQQNMAVFRPGRITDNSHCIHLGALHNGIVSLHHFAFYS